MINISIIYIYASYIIMLHLNTELLHSNTYSERFHPEWLLLDKGSSDEESVLCQTKVNMVTISPSCPSKHFEHIF